MKVITIILKIIYFILLDILLFGLTAKHFGKKCKYNCKNCENWSCTHGKEDQKHFYPIRDWSWWCNV